MSMAGGIVGAGGTSPAAGGSGAVTGSAAAGSGRAQVMDGKVTAAAIKAELAERVRRLRERGIVPGLGTILLGSDPGSQIYVNGKHRDSAEIGVESIRVDLPADASPQQVLDAVERLNADPKCSGFIVQLPLPEGHDESAVLAAVDPNKDVDGLHPMNLGVLAGSSMGPLPAMIACTPIGIIELGRRYGLDWKGAHVCIVGLGRTVGRPLSLLASHESVGATVTTCNVLTRDLARHTREADIIVAAAGVPHLVKPDMVKPGAAVFDVGVSRQMGPDGKSHIVGDVDPAVAEIAGWLSPNPGGVGLMTRAMLLHNVVLAAEATAK